MTNECCDRCIPTHGINMDCLLPSCPCHQGVKDKSLKNFLVKGGLKALEGVKQTNNEWKVQFDTQFDHFNEDRESGKRICNGDCEQSYDLADIKSFIVSLVEQTRAEMIAEITEIIKFRESELEGNSKFLPDTEKLELFARLKELTYYRNLLSRLQGGADVR